MSLFSWVHSKYQSSEMMGNISKGDLAVFKHYCFYRWNFKCLGRELSDFVLLKGKAGTQQNLLGHSLQDFTSVIV